MRTSFTPTSRTSTPGSNNRSDQVRQRKTIKSRERTSAAAGRILTPPPVRPVVVRDAGVKFGQRSSSAIYRQTAQTNPRRQFYVAMDNAGAEIRLPAIQLVNPGWRLLSGLLAIMMVIGIYSFTNSDFFRITQVDVQGLQRIQPKDLDSVTRLENLSIVEVQPGLVEQQITAAFPELADINVSIEMPNYVTISARERQPMLAWQQAEKILWVDTEGYVFPARGKAGALVTVKTDDSLPLAAFSSGGLATDAQAQTQSTQSASVLSSASSSDPAFALTGRKADLHLLNATLQLAKKLPKDTQIIYDKANGLGWNDPGGWQVFIGKDLADFDVKFAAYQTILKNLQDQGVKLIEISVEHPDAPFYRAVEEVQPEE